jgi:putative membrane protein
MKKTLTTLVAAAVLAGCGGEPRNDEAMAMDTTALAPAEPAPAAAPASTVTDPQIAAIVVAANRVDIEAGELAKTKATNPKVREFANRMVTDHTGVNQAATDLVTRLGVTPEENPTSQQLTQGGQQNLDNLRSLNGAAFDRAYIDHEVEYHQAVLDALDNTLIPNAQNAELKSLLQTSRPAFVAHLEHAREVQSSLGTS